MDRYIVHSFDDVIADFRNDQCEEGRTWHRNIAERLALGAVAAGRASAVVQRLSDGKIVAYYDGEEADNL